MLIDFDKELGEFVYLEGKPVETNKFFYESFIRYFNILYKLYDKATNANEFSTILTMLGVRGLQDAGWDPFETTNTVINGIIDFNDDIKDSKVQKNLHLWIYGHILEASEPYERIMNLINIIKGGEYSASQFPASQSGPQMPGQKINTIKQATKKLEDIKIGTLFDELWNKELRNSIFHSDYSIYEGNVRTRNPDKEYPSELVNEYVNKSIAYFKAIQEVQRSFIASYTESIIIDTPNGFGEKNEKARLIIRDGHGVVGIKDNWSRSELKQGKIPFRLGKFYYDEMELLEKDKFLFMLPER